MAQVKEVRVGFWAAMSCKVHMCALADLFVLRRALGMMLCIWLVGTTAMLLGGGFVACSQLHAPFSIHSQTTHGDLKERMKTQGFALVHGTEFRLKILCLLGMWTAKLRMR